MHLWHIYSHHRLIRWRIVTHGCIDGFSRYVIHLYATDNNLSETVLYIFRNSTNNYGVPSRCRGDRGSENTLVHRFMEQMRGAGRGSYIAGRSVHNQRIERLWRDVFSKVISFYHRLFTFMETEGILDASSTLHLCILHLVFLPLINKALSDFLIGWNNHVIKGVYQTPTRMFTCACAEWQMDRPPLNPDIDDGDVDRYGVDWQGPVPFPDSDVRLPRMPSPLTEQQLVNLSQLVDLTRSSDSFHVDVFMEALTIAQTLLWT